jgi:hypothetical protein
MNPGDFIVRNHPFLAHNFGVIVRFDSDGDPIILWDGGSLEEEYSSAITVLSNDKKISAFTSEHKNKKIL